MNIKHFVTGLLGFSALTAAALSYANIVNFVNVNNKYSSQEAMSISYVVFSQKSEHSPLIPIEAGTTHLKPGQQHSTNNFEVKKNSRVWVQPIALNGKDIPNLKEKCKLLVTKESSPVGTIGIALYDNDHALSCEVHG